MLSKSTTRKPMLSKSLCHVQNHAFGLVSTNRYFHDFHTSDFYSEIPESFYFKAFLHSYLSTLDINTTVSTCLESTIKMSWEDNTPLAERYSTKNYNINIVLKLKKDKTYSFVSCIDIVFEHKYYI